MRDPVMPPFLALVGISLILWGCRRLRASFRKPDADFRVSPHVRPGRFEAPLVRASEALDSLSFLLVGVVVFAFGVVDLMSFF
jgi:hypothetical protein